MVTLNKRDQEQMEKAQDLMGDGPGDDLGFVRSLFYGRMRLDKIMPYPQQPADEAERTEELLSKLDVFLNENLDPVEIDEKQEIPEYIIRGLGELGVLGMTVPREYGGGGFGHTAYCRVLERVAQTCPSTAVMISAHQSIGLKAIILQGTEEQKCRYLPVLARGEKLAAFCLTEPGAGSDAANVQTQAELSDDGDYWILNGDKKFSTNGAMAGVMTVMARTPDESGRSKVTAFIVTPDMEGFEIVSNNRTKHGIRGSWQGTLRFNNMRVPKENILGELGRGLRVALEVLDYGRCTLSAGCLGAAKRGVQLAVERARTRTQFERPIGSFHLIQKKIARMAELTVAMDAMTYMCAGMVDKHDGDIMLETAISKLFCSESLWTIVDDLMQIWGGEGYMAENGIERMLRDARINRIVEGTTEVMTAFVALMGMKTVGEEFEDVAKAARHPLHNFGRLARFAKQEWDDIVIGHTDAFDDLHPDLIDEGYEMTLLTKSFARDIVRVLSTHREKIIDMQLVHERITAVATELYAMGSVLSQLQCRLERHSGDGSDPTLQRDVMIGKAYCHHAAVRIEDTLKELFDNHDHETLAVAEAMLQMEVDETVN